MNESPSEEVDIEWKWSGVKWSGAERDGRSFSHSRNTLSNRHIVIETMTSLRCDSRWTEAPRLDSLSIPLSIFLFFIFVIL